jgi:hypothetical protein
VSTYARICAQRPGLDTGQTACCYRILNNGIAEKARSVSSVEICGICEVDIAAAKKGLVSVPCQSIGHCLPVSRDYALLLRVCRCYVCCELGIKGADVGNVGNEGTNIMVSTRHRSQVHSTTYKRSRTTLLVDIEDALKAGQVVEPLRGIHCCAIAVGVAAANKASTMADLLESLGRVLLVEEEAEVEAEYGGRSGDVFDRLGFISQAGRWSLFGEKNPRFRAGSRGV